MTSVETMIKQDIFQNFLLIIQAYTRVRSHRTVTTKCIKEGKKSEGKRGSSRTESSKHERTEKGKKFNLITRL